ncbi:MAG: hypothetical protein J3K34DRAFT_243968 [Monoraphidium minutum]|nr:MAG: hypothetical protein J3K34DRAFT_243968 [Monoraphidium minutum]
MGHIKLFLGAAKDRLEALLAAPTSTPGGRMRPFALAALLLAADAAAAAGLARAGRRLGWRRALLFAFDAAAVAAEGCKVLLRYSLHIMDQFALSTETALLRLSSAPAPPALADKAPPAAPPRWLPPLALWPPAAARARARRRPRRGRRGRGAAGLHTTPSSRPTWQSTGWRSRSTRTSGSATAARCPRCPRCC